MKGVDLSNYALEDLLAFDDIFLDYFNNFLKNPAFPQPIQYNRYQSFFEEIDQVPNAIIFLDHLPNQVTHQLAKTFNISSSPRGDDDDTPNLNRLEQQKVFDWVRQERLPLFFRTDFFREFKLCRLLTRSLEEEDDTHSQTSSQMIGGYSRQSPPISDTLSTEENECRMSLVAGLFYHSGSKRLNESRNTRTETESRLFKSNNIDMALLDRFNKFLFQRPGSRALSVPSFFPFKSVNFSTNQASVFLKTNDEPLTSLKSGTSAKKEPATKIKTLHRHDSMGNLADIDLTVKDSMQRFKTSLVNSETSAKQPEAGDGGAKKSVDNEIFFNELTHSYNDEVDFTAASTNNYIKKKNLERMHINEKTRPALEAESEEELDNADPGVKLDDNISLIEDEYEGGLEDEEEDLADNEGLHASINQYKLKFLGSVRGMLEFKEFLKATSGNKLIQFWLDCEFYRDSMQDYDQIENMATRNRLFRDINEKYVFAFSKKMHQKISKNYLESSTLNHTIFDNIQYDILRRIRAYWVPRFILSKLKAVGKDYGYTYPLPPITPLFSRQSTYISMHSAGRRQAVTEVQQGTTQQYEDESLLLYDKVKEALHADKAAGGPFLRYISSKNPDNLPLILFWYDVCDFYEIDAIGFDKNSRLQHAWAIYNSYLSPTARFNIGLPQDVAEEARKSLQIISNSNTFNTINAIDKKLFQPVMEQIIPYLQNSWIKFIKDDVFKYTQSRLAALLVKKQSDRASEETTEGGEEQLESENEIQELFDKIPEPDMVIENSVIHLKRPWIQKFLDMNAQKATKKVLTEEEKIERMERIRMMEIERKKALKKARQRNNLEKQKLHEKERDNFKDSSSYAQSDNVLFGKKKTTETNLEASDHSFKKTNSLEADKSAYFNKMISSNKSMMQLYRKYFVDSNRRDFLNKFNAFLEAKQYTDSLDPAKKAKLALNLYQAYLTNNSKKKILPLSEKLQTKLNADMKIKDTRGHIRPRTPFCKELVKDFRPSLEDEFVSFCNAKRREHELESPEDFAALTQTELLILLGDSFNARNFDFDEEKGEGKLTPTKEDKQELIKYLYEWSIGNYPEVFWNYFIHLGDYGPKDGMPFLDKDLLFCIDAVRMREINGEAVLKQKATMIYENYLDSQIQPLTQIDISNDTQSKLAKAVNRIIVGTNTPHDITLFDEVRVQLVKDLLPYWAGYMSYIKNNQNDPPLSKRQKKLKERLEEFLSLKNTSPDDFKLPLITPRTPQSPSKKSRENPLLSSSHNFRNQTNRLSNIVFSIATGIKYKDEKTMQREESHVLSDKSLVGNGKMSALSK